MLSSTNLIFPPCPPEQAIDIIIPHVRSVCLAKGGEKALKEMSLSIVSTFVDASADMAAHRFKTFLARLVKCLGERDYLWILTLLLLKGSPNGYFGFDELGTENIC